MSTTNTNLQILSESDKQRLDSILIAFDMEWTEELLPVCVQELPPPGSLLRHAALLELIKIELDRQWRQGRQVLLEQYLEAFPELGTRDTVPVCLILAEYEARKQWDQGASLSTFAERFPAQIGDVQNHMENTQELEQVTHAEMAEGNVPGIAGYEILGVLGKGGMGIVYKARHRQLDRLVALKMILHGRHASANELARFAKEMEAVARLRHPGIVQLYEVGEQKGLPYCVLEFCPGGNLTRRLAETTLPPVAAAELVEQLARAIHEAHEHHIIHRDLKPDNVLFVEGPETPIGQCQAKIADFGLAKKLDDGTEYTQSGAIVGTPSYMAPEQASSKFKTIGPATDLFALGAVLYECLTGRPPFKGATVHETLYQLLHEEPVLPRHIQPHTPRDLETICLKCLQKEPSKRYASAVELAGDLKRFREGVPIQARRVSSAERFWRWCRRHPALATLSASVLLLLIAVAVISSVSAVWLHREQQATLKQLGLTQKAEEKAKGAERHAKQQLFFSKLAQARALQRTGRDGQRFGSLKLLKEAAKMIRHFGLENKLILKLRNEYIAAAALPADLRVVEEMETRRPYYVPPRFHRYLRRDGQGNMCLYQRSDNKMLACLPCRQHVGAKDTCWNHLFSPDGRFVALRYTGDQCLIWDLQTHTLARNVPMTGDYFGLDFFPDGKRVAYSPMRDKRIHCRDLITGKELQPLGSLPESAHRLAVCPQGKFVVATDYSSHTVRVFETASGKVVKSFSGGGKGTGTLGWSLDGTYLAIPNGLAIDVWHVPSWQKQSISDAHDWFGVYTAYSPAAELLFSTSWDGTTRLRHPFTGRELVRTESGQGGMAFSRDGKYLSFTKGEDGGGFWEVTTSRTLRQIAVSAGKTVERYSVAFHPKGHLFACGSDAGVHLCDLNSGRQIAALNIGPCRRLVFHPTDGSLISVGTAGLYRWLIHGDPRTGTVRLGPAQLLVRSIRDREASLALSPDGRFLAAVGGHNSSSVLVINLEKMKVIFSGTHLGATYVAISPDGKWVATSVRMNEKQPGLRIWDVQRRKLVTEDLWPGVESGPTSFSPDGHWLVGNSFDGETRIWDVGTWRPVHTLQKHSVRRSVLNFSPDAKMLVLTIRRGQLLLLKCGTWEELATLTAQNTQGHGHHTFSADGTQLAVASRPLQLWDLREVRKELAEVELDWNAPAYPAAKPQARPSKELRVEGVPFGMELFHLRRSPPNEKKSLDFVRKYFQPDGQQIQGELTAKDPFDPVRKTCRHRLHKVNLMAGKAYAIELKSKAFDPFLRLEDATKRTLRFNDDIDYKNKNLNSLLIFVPEQTAEYRIIVTSFEPSMGDYTLTIRSKKNMKANKNGD